jgi:hypothetical protein
MDTQPAQLPQPQPRPQGFDWMKFGKGLEHLGCAMCLLPFAVIGLLIIAAIVMSWFK